MGEGETIPVLKSQDASDKTTSTRNTTQRYTHTPSPVSPTAQLLCQVMTELKEGSEEWRHSGWREGRELLETFGKGLGIDASGIAKVRKSQPSRLPQSWILLSVPRVAFFLVGFKKRG